MYKDEDYLMISGIQHFCFCRRQWALIHVEQQWAENLRTTEGILLHKNAHDESKHEKRGDLIIMRGLRVKSDKLGVTGNCDVVEFYKDDNGVSLNSYDNRWRPFPVEYKHGRPKDCDADILQLCCQAMCLEEMLACKITSGAIFYGDTQRREKVEFTEELRKKVITIADEMHHYWNNGWTPKGEYSKACIACSLYDLCVPKLNKSKSVSKYISEVIQDNEEIT